MAAHVLMVVLAGERDGANTDARDFDAVGGGRTFTEGLSASGRSPATHYWAAAAMDETILGRVNALAAARYPAAVVHRYELDDSGVPLALLARLGLRTLDAASR